MKKSNKGFSLVELLVAIAAFSIVMIAIISLMSSSSISFRNESMEVDLEKDSQILLAQVEEAIVDCKSITRSGNDYTITNNDGSTTTLKYVGTNVLMNDELLANNISGFQINGLKASDGLSDNTCVVDIQYLSKAGGNTGKEFSYHGSKQVYFRNDLDGVINASLPDLDSAAPGPGTSDEKTLVLGRYEVVNLYSRFGLATVNSWTPSGTDGIAFCDSTYVDSTTKGLTSVHYLSSGVTSLYITTSATCNTSTNTSFAGVLKGYKAKPDGSADTTKEITVNVSVPIVKLQKGSGIIEVPTVEVNNSTANGGGGFYSYLQFDGFCARDYEKYFGGNIKGKMQIKLNGTSKGSVEGDIITAKSTGFATGFNQQIQMGGGGWDRMEQFGLFYDYTNPQYLVVKFHNGDKPSSSYLTTNKVEAVVTITYPTAGGTTTTSETYRVYTGGSGLSGL